MNRPFPRQFAILQRKCPPKMRMKLWYPTTISQQLFALLSSHILLENIRMCIEKIGIIIIQWNFTHKNMTTLNSGHAHFRKTCPVAILTHSPARTHTHTQSHRTKHRTHLHHWIECWRVRISYVVSMYDFHYYLYCKWHALAEKKSRNSSGIERKGVQINTAEFWIDIVVNLLLGSDISMYLRVCRFYGNFIISFSSVTFFFMPPSTSSAAQCFATFSSHLHTTSTSFVRSFGRCVCV